MAAARFVTVAVAAALAFGPRAGAGEPEAPAPAAIDPHAQHHHHHHHGAMSNAQHWDAMTSPDGCAPDQYWSFAMSMCAFRPTERGRVAGMVMGALFAADVWVQGPRGTIRPAMPNWLMGDVGVDLASWNRLELDVMLTAERWTFADEGYPLPFQVGEENEHGMPFVDAQHPHSSPLMGLALGDAISFARDRTRLLRLWFAPRGESTDGPIAFMHRATGSVNPDAPLGHHIGQDVGHISSTVIGASVLLGGTTIEASAFHGREPQPDAVDLPIGVPDSYALRASQQIDRHFTVAASFAYVTNPEGALPPSTVLRASASAYGQWDLPAGWRAHATLVYGGISNYDGATFLSSLLGEALFTDFANQLWARSELVQRTPAELQVASPAPNAPAWVGTLTLGYTRALISVGPIDLGAGGSATLDCMSDVFAPAYGGRCIFSGKVFLAARGMQMLDWRPAR